MSEYDQWQGPRCRMSAKKRDTSPAVELTCLIATERCDKNRFIKGT